MGWIADKTTLAVDEIFKRMRVDTDPIYTPRFKKFVRWFGYSAIPFVFSIGTILAMLYVFNLAYNKVGFEKTVIVLLVLLWLKERR